MYTNLNAEETREQMRRTREKLRNKVPKKDSEKVLDVKKINYKAAAYTAMLLVKQGVMAPETAIRTVGEL